VFLYRTDITVTVTTHTTEEEYQAAVTDVAMGTQDRYVAGHPHSASIQVYVTL